MNGPIDVEGLAIKLKPLLDRRFAWPHEFLIYQFLAIAEDNCPVDCPASAVIVRTTAEEATSLDEIVRTSVLTDELPNGKLLGGGEDLRPNSVSEMKHGRANYGAC
jgi:hypothetical protein